MNTEKLAARLAEAMAILNEVAAALKTDEAPHPIARAKAPTHYRTRTKITLARAATLTGLSQRTIQRLLKSPRNTGFVGLNVEEYVLVGWARKYAGDKSLAHTANMMNHPIALSALSGNSARKLGA